MYSSKVSTQVTLCIDKRHFLYRFKTLFMCLYHILLK